MEAAKIAEQGDPLCTAEDGGDNVADDERDEAESKATPSTDTEEVVKLLKEIRELLVDGREKQSRYLWLLFPIMAFQLIQALLLAARL